MRNEHANVQYRINGIQLPDGVGSFGQIVDTGIVGSLALITGAMPAQFGLRTAGVVDIQTKQSAFDNAGTVSVYGGSHGTITPSFEYGGTAGQTQYFVSGRFFASNIGLENPTSANTAIHDHTDQDKGFAYVSTVIDPSEPPHIHERRGVEHAIRSPTIRVRRRPSPPSASPISIRPISIENQNEFNQFNVLALQHSAEGLDLQISYFNRTSIVHFMPDPIGDLIFNGVASDVYRQSVVNGIQTDASYRDCRCAYAARRLHGQRRADPGQQLSSVFPGRSNWSDVRSYPSASSIPAARPASCSAPMSQDEWKITNQLTLNAGLRFDQMVQYVNANQFSPRISLTYQPFDGTTFHAGYARYFTPPQQVLAAPTNLALVQGTTQQPEVNVADPVLPERSHYFDVGVTQTRDARPRGRRRRLLQDRARPARRRPVRRGLCAAPRSTMIAATNTGVELTANYNNGNFNAYGNIAGRAPARDQCRLEPVPVRGRRACLHRHPLHLHRSRPARIGIGGRVLSLERHALFRST